MGITLTADALGIIPGSIARSLSRSSTYPNTSYTTTGFGIDLAGKK